MARRGWCRVAVAMPRLPDLPDESDRVVTQPFPPAPTRIPGGAARRSARRAPRRGAWHRLHTSQSKLLRAAVTAMLVTVAGSGVAALDMRKDVTVTVDGEQVHVVTYKTDVAEALADAGYDIAATDRVNPPLDAPLTSGDAVTVSRAREVTMVRNGVPATVTTTATTVGELLGDQGLTPADLRTQHPGDGLPLAGATVEVSTPVPVTIADGSDTLRHEQLRGDTVAEALRRAGRPLGERDVVLPAADATVVPGMVVRVLRVAVTTDTTTEPFDAQPAIIDDPNREEGTTEVIQPGTPGQREKTWSVTTINGAEVERTVTAERVITEPVAAQLRRGTRPAPTTPDVAQGSVWDALAMCEATGNWSINTGNGFSGGLQFTDSTWLAYGGGQFAPQAWQASREQQIVIGQKVQAGQGWGAWPACSAKLGLR